MLSQWRQYFAALPQRAYVQQGLYRCLQRLDRRWVNGFFQEPLDVVLAHGFHGERELFERDAQHLGRLLCQHLLGFNGTRIQSEALSRARATRAT